MTLEEYYQMHWNPNYDPESQKTDDERFEFLNSLKSKQLEQLDKLILSILDSTAFNFLREVEENLMEDKSIGLTIWWSHNRFYQSVQGWLRHYWHQRYRWRRLASGVWLPGSTGSAGYHCQFTAGVSGGWLFQIPPQSGGAPRQPITAGRAVYWP